MSSLLDVRSPLRTPFAEPPPAAIEEQLDLEGPGEDVSTSTNPVDGLEYSRIPAAETWIGAGPDDPEAREQEQPRHRVRLTRSYWLGSTAVTVGAYRRYCEATGESMPEPPAFNRNWKFEDHPIVNVSHGDASEYCQWAGGRLPTEAEWEHAATGGKASVYPWGADPDHDRANFGRALWGTTPVRRYRPNGLGLHDMAGNVWEWCEDWFGPYRGGRHIDPCRRERSTARILRGGSWLAGWWSIRCTHRGRFPPEARLGTVGFRCVWLGRTAEPNRLAA